MSSLLTESSWIIKEKATGKVLFETWNPQIPKKLNKKKYVSQPILEYLGNFNKSVKELGELV